MSSKKSEEKADETGNAVILAAPRTSEGPISTLFVAKKEVGGVCLRYSHAAAKGIESLKNRGIL